MLNACEGDLRILQVFQVTQDGLAGIPGLGASGAFRERAEELIDIIGQPDGQHRIDIQSPLPMLYDYSSVDRLLSSGSHNGTMQVRELLSGRRPTPLMGGC